MVYFGIIIYWLVILAQIIYVNSIQAAIGWFLGGLVLFGLWFWAYYQFNYIDNRETETDKQAKQRFIDTGW